MRKIACFEGVNAATSAVAQVVPPTPLLRFDHDGHSVFAKAESLQPIGAFKLRGAWWRVSSLNDQERAAGVVAYSSGNHAQGVAWAAKRLGVHATIIMPADAPKAKLANTRALGAHVITYDRATENREQLSADLVAKSGATLVPPFDDPWIIEGQGSAGIEAIMQMKAMGYAAPDAVITCCGGGGLSAGMALACPMASITIVEPEGWDDMCRSLANGTIVAVPDSAPFTACDALMTKQPSPLTFAILQARQATGITVSEQDVEIAIRFAFDRLRLVVEPGGAVALAAILAGKATLGARTLITISGGNIDAAQFAGILTRT